MLDARSRLRKLVVGRMLAWLAIASLVLQSGPLQAISTQAPDLDTVLAEIRQSAKMNARHYDRETIIDEQDYEAEAIIEFVSEKVAFQPYSGVLRGIEGTLAGRAGNAHDQALTLAAMLKDAGYDAQILAGTLSEDQAKELVAQTRTPDYESLEPSGSDGQVLQRILEQARKHGKDADEFLAETNSYAVVLARKLEGQLAANSMVETALRNSIPYRWVRYRDSAAGGWAEIHPAYPQASEWQLRFDHVEGDTIDPAAVQSVGLQVWIEDSAGEQHSVSGLWEAPTAGLMGKEITLELYSDAALREDAWLDPVEMFERSEFFFVKINGQVPEDGKVFDLYGDVLPGAAMDGLNSIFSTLNRRGRAAADALMNMNASDSEESDKPTKQLAKVWVEIILSQPDGGIEGVERVLFEGLAIDQRPQSAGRLVQRWDLDVMGTTPIPQYYRALSSDRFAAALSGYRQLQDYLDEPGVASSSAVAERAAKWLKSPSLARLVYLRQVFDRFETPENVVSYVDQANVLAIRQGYATFDDGWQQYEMADIVTNSRVSIEREDGRLQAAPGTSVARGVWETRAEAWNPGFGASVPVSKTSAYQALTAVSLEEFENERAENHLKLAAPDTNGWWQIDARTGATIGMQRSAAGVGGSATEFITVVTFAVSFVFFLVGSGLCMQTSDDWECCVASNAVVATVGFAIGWAAGLIAVAMLTGVGAGAAVGISAAQAGGGAVVGSVASVAADLGLTRLAIDCE